MVNLTHLFLHRNGLSGSIPAQLGNLVNLKDFRVYTNRLTGTIPWEFWERVTRRELAIHIGNTLIRGFEPPPQRSNRPGFSTNPADNGNASHHSVAYYQGPLVWAWNWNDDPLEYQRPILGRWAALAVQDRS